MYLRKSFSAINTWLSTSSSANIIALNLPRPRLAHVPQRTTMHIVASYTDCMELFAFYYPRHTKWRNAHCSVLHKLCGIVCAVCWCACRDSFIHATGRLIWRTWLILVCDRTFSYVRHLHSSVWHVMRTCVKRRIYVCDKVHSYVWHASVMCMTRLMHVRHDALMRVTQLNHVSNDTTHSYLRYNSFIYVTSLMHTCNMTHVCASTITRVPWIIFFFFMASSTILRTPHVPTTRPPTTHTLCSYVSYRAGSPSWAMECLEYSPKKGSSAQPQPTHTLAHVSAMWVGGYKKICKYTCTHKYVCIHESCIHIYLYACM